MINNLFLALVVLTNIIIYLKYEKLSKLLNVYDLPNERKLHKKKTPLLGGFILIANFLFFSALHIFNKHNSSEIFYFFSFSKFYIFFFTVILIFLLGFFDDKFDLNPNIKLFLLTLIISTILWFDNSLLISKLTFTFMDNSLVIGKYSFLFTLLCFLLFINACNMFDGINLQSTCYFIILIFYLNISGYNSLLLNFLLISLVIIFLLNKNGKIFVGDSGVYLISFIMGYVLVKIYNLDNKLSSDLIFILMMVPGIDMFRLFLLRLLNKKNPFSPDRNHIHHLLLNAYSYKKTIIILNVLILYPIVLTMFNFEKLFIIIIYLIQYLILIVFLEKKKTNTG